MKHLLVGLFLFFSLVAQCELVTDSILIQSHYRTFSYNQPGGDIAGGSLMFVMHGSGGTSSDMIKRTTKLEAMAAREKLLVVYPNGYQHYWNECRKYATSAANKENIDENAFFEAMIKYFHDKFKIDLHKIFAAGFSGGGQMAYKLGLTMPGKVKAITAVVANMPDAASCDCELAGRPLPVLIINGTADNVNPYNGGEMFVNNSSYGVVRSTENTFAYWSTLAGYTGAPAKELLPDTDTTDQKIIEKYIYTGSNKPTVSLLKVIGGKHDYPGDIDVYMYAWEFFRSVK
ncbi:MAG: poly(3-hydroxybutyrate) depolymerase-like protein [Ferruginibacter sp.]|nr:poly(3-hydroxybutyrate) depolymerase-like protein [Ferruginibacter sp.]